MFSYSSNLWKAAKVPEDMVVTGLWYYYYCGLLTKILIFLLEWVCLNISVTVMRNQAIPWFFSFQSEGTKFTFYSPQRYEKNLSRNSNTYSWFWKILLLQIISLRLSCISSASCSHFLFEIWSLCFVYNMQNAKSVNFRHCDADMPNQLKIIHIVEIISTAPKLPGREMFLPLP